MKTAISIRDDVFCRAEDFARRRKMTRSALFAAAVEEYTRRHRQDDVTARLNRVYAKRTSRFDPVLQELQRLSLPREDW